MQQVSLDQAQNSLATLVQAALDGEQVLIAKDERHVVQLVPRVLALNVQPRTPGSAKGLIRMSDDFDDPLSEFDEYTK